MAKLSHKGRYFKLLEVGRLNSWAVFNKPPFRWQELAPIIVHKKWIHEIFEDEEGRPVVVLKNYLFDGVIYRLDTPEDEAQALLDKKDCVEVKTYTYGVDWWWEDKYSLWHITSER